VNEFERMVGRAVEHAAATTPAVAVVEDRVRRRRRRRGAVGATAVAALVVVMVALAVRAPAGPELVTGAGTLPPGTGTAPPGTAPPYPAPVTVPAPPPEPVGDRPVIEVRVEPEAADAFTPRRVVVVNHTGAPYATCGISFERWLGDGWGDYRSLGFPKPDQVYLMDTGIGDPTNHLCPNDAFIGNLSAPAGGTTERTVPFNSELSSGDAVRNPGYLWPGTYRIVRFRHEDPEVVGRFTVTP
jgi:hypothetical protein